MERNNPTLTYAASQRGFFYDLEVATLEDQAIDVIHQHEEMGESLGKTQPENQSKSNIPAPHQRSIWIEAEVLGIPAQADTIDAKVDPDLGKYRLYEYPQYKYSFKTPTLRNVTKTAPHMHNEVYKTQEDVLDFYNRGGGAGICIQIDNQTLSSEK